MYILEAKKSPETSKEHKRIGNCVWIDLRSEMTSKQWSHGCSQNKHIYKSQCQLRKYFPVSHRIEEFSAQLCRVNKIITRARFSGLVRKCSDDSRSLDLKEQIALLLDGHPW